MSRSSKIIAAGFLIRALAGQALFWISWLRLPFARSLQLGDGFWFFALDGPKYLRNAVTLAAHGPGGIAFLGEDVPSRFFVQVLAVFVGVFGGVASVGILLNCIAFAGACLLFTRMGREDNVALAAIAFSPAAILFALQPLKDTLVWFLMAALVAAFVAWEKRPRFAVAIAMLAATYALAGIRWYLATILWLASAIFFLIATLRAQRKGVALGVHVLLFILLSQCVRLGALDFPPRLARMLDPVALFSLRPAVATNYVRDVRSGYETTPGATTIEPGPVVAVAPSVQPSTSAKFVPAFAATFLPHALSEAVGLTHIGGGRGFWLFADVDTIVFTLVVIYAAVTLVRGRSRISATTVMVVVAFFAMMVPMLYSVTNFGTLFRLRLMLYLLAAAAPLTLRER